MTATSITHSRMPELQRSAALGEVNIDINYRILALYMLKRVLSAAVDTATDPKAPRIASVAEPEDIQKATGLGYLHSSHCLGSGDIMVSAMGDPSGKGSGNFILFDQDLKVCILPNIRVCRVPMCFHMTVHQRPS